MLQRILELCLTKCRSRLGITAWYVLGLICVCSGSVGGELVIFFRLLVVVCCEFFVSMISETGLALAGHVRDVLVLFETSISWVFLFFPFYCYFLLFVSRV